MLLPPPKKMLDFKYALLYGGVIEGEGEGFFFCIQYEDSQLNFFGRFFTLHFSQILNDFRCSYFDPFPF